jgi:AcrR family transcriptional regulator
MASASENVRPLRADAERNRARVLAAARTVLGERGLEATTTDDIARAAGVGVGTVYRRFPSKDELVIAALDELAEELLADVCAGSVADDPWEAVRGALEALAAGLHANLAFIEAVYAGAGEKQPLRAFRADLQAALEPMFARAHAAGVLRRDVVIEDVPLLVVSVARLAPKRPDVDPEIYRRYLAVLLDGLRPGSASALPLGPPPR